MSWDTVASKLAIEGVEPLGVARDDCHWFMPSTNMRSSV
jgi:hypothetical protein